VFKSVAKNFSIFTLAMIAEAVITFLFLAFVARQFGPSLFGKYILIFAYVHIVSVCVNAGIDPIALRELARHRDNSSELFGDIFSLRLVLAVFGYLALMLVAALSGESPEYMTLIGIAGLMLIIEPFTASYRVYYTAHERMTIPSAYSVASAALSALAGGTLLILGFGLFELILSNVAISFAIGLIWSVRFRTLVLRFRFRARFTAWRRLLLLIIPFAPIHAGNQINRVLNVILLGQIKGPLPMEQSVGYYSPASSVSNTIVRLVMGMRRALMPPIAAKLGQGHSVTREIDVALKMIMALFCLPLILGTAYMSPEIIALLFGDQYGPSAMVLQMLGWAAALQIAAFVPEIFLFAHPDHKMQEYIAGPVTSVALNALLCILLIPEYGILGAAAAAIAGRLVYLWFVAHHYRRQAPGQALNPHHFIDVGVLFISSFIVWHFTFTWMNNAWLAFTMAAIATLPLIAMFLLYLRSQVQARTPA
jgi:O-antigen/teichoic acid export membrane protein